MKPSLIACLILFGLLVPLVHAEELSRTFVAVPGNVLSALDKGTPRGIFVQAVDAVLRRMGRTPSYLLIPTTLALASLEEGKLDVGTAIVPLARDQQRVWFSQPVLTEYSVVATLRGQAFALRRLADLHGRKLGARVGYQYPLLDGDGEVRVTRYHSDGEMIRALLFHEVEAILIAGMTEVNSLRTEGMIARFDILPVAIDTVPLVAAFSRQTFSTDEVRTFDAEMAAFKQTPAWQEILNQNGFADLVNPWPLLSRD